MPERGIGALVEGLQRVDVLTRHANRRGGEGTDRRSGTPPSVPRLTGRSIVTGTKRYPSDIVLPGLRHGQVLRPPAVGEMLRSIDLGDVAGEDVAVVHDGSFVGVVAASDAQARVALARAKAEWDLADQPGDADLEPHLRTHPIEDEGWEGGFHRESGDVDRALATAQVRVDATYRTAFIAHVPMETRSRSQSGPMTAGSPSGPGPRCRSVYGRRGVGRGSAIDEDSGSGHRPGPSVAGSVASTPARSPSRPPAWRERSGRR